MGWAEVPGAASPCLGCGCGGGGGMVSEEAEVGTGPERLARSWVWVVKGSLGTGRRGTVVRWRRLRTHWPRVGDTGSPSVPSAFSRFGSVCGGAPASSSVSAAKEFLHCLGRSQGGWWGVGRGCCILEVRGGRGGGLLLPEMARNCPEMPDALPVSSVSSDSVKATLPLDLQTCAKW